MGKVIFLDGNIGSGKTTMLSYLKKQSDLIILEEPLEEWTLLDKYYKEPSKYAYLFQVQVLMTKFNQLYKTLQKNPLETIVCERNFKTSHKVFGKIIYKNNFISKEEYNQLKRLTNDLQNILETTYEINFVNLYLSVETPEIMNRIKKRGRDCESNITMDFINQVEKFYEKGYGFLNYKIDNNGSEKETLTEIEKFLEII